MTGKIQRLRGGMRRGAFARICIFRFSLLRFRVIFPESTRQMSGVLWTSGQVFCANGRLFNEMWSLLPRLVFRLLGTAGSPPAAVAKNMREIHNVRY